MMFMMMTIIIIVMMMVMMFLLILLLTRLSNPSTAYLRNDWELLWTHWGSRPSKACFEQRSEKKKNTGLPLVDLAKYGEVSNIQVSFRKKKCFRRYLKTVSFQVWLNHVKSYNLSTVFVDSPNIIDRFRLAFWPEKSQKVSGVFFSVVRDDCLAIKLFVCCLFKGVSLLVFVSYEETFSPWLFFLQLPNSTSPWIFVHSFWLRLWEETTDSYDSSSGSSEAPREQQDISSLAPDFSQSPPVLLAQFGDSKLNLHLPRGRGTRIDSLDISGHQFTGWFEGFVILKYKEYIQCLLGTYNLPFYRL